MTKKKIAIIAIVVVLLLLICGAGIFFAVRGQKGPEDEDDDPVDDGQKNPIVSESDIEVGDYEDFDWETEAGDAVKKDDSFSQKQNSSSQNQGGNTSVKDDGIGLRHDESQNTGIEVDFDSWDKE